MRFIGRLVTRIVPRPDRAMLARTLSPMLRPILACALVFCALGCRTPAHGPEGRPDGFTLSATVHPAEQPPTPALPRGLRQAKYLVEADARLRVATGPIVLRPAFAYPPILRRLSPWQMDAIWRLTHDAGLADRGHPGRVLGPAPSPTHPESPIAVFEVTRNFAPLVIVVVLDGQSPEARAAAELLDHLAELAWIE
jgi:hypothetical protein